MNLLLKTVMVMKESGVLSIINKSVNGTFSTQERCLLRSDCEILEQTSGKSSVVILSIYLQKTVGPSLVRNLQGALA